jgi:hypothetical protein
MRSVLERGRGVAMAMFGVRARTLVVASRPGTRRPRDGRGLASGTLLWLCALIVASLVSSAPALAAPETPETGKATGITATSALLDGVLNPNAAGQAGVYYFAYAPRGAACTEYGFTAETISAGFEKEPVEPPVEVAGLEPNTLYTFCLVDRNEVGQATVGSAKTFTTLSVPPVVSGENASGVNSTSATLEGQVNPNNQVTSCEIQYGTTTSYGTNVPCEPSSLEGFGEQRASVSVAGLEAGTTYHFRIVAESAGKEKTEGADQAFTTVPAPNTDPVSSITATTATLNGHLTLNAIDTQYFFFYKVGSECTGGSATSAEDAGSGLGTLVSPSAPLTGLRTATQYAACMVTSNVFGSEQGAPVTFVTSTAAPKINSESSETNGPVVVLNAQITPNGGETTYRFEYGETEAYGTSIPVSAGNIGAGNESVSVPAAEPTGLKNSTIYHYRVVATSQYGTTEGEDRTFLAPPIMGPLPRPGVSGLPDERVYEQVTPSSKNGNSYSALISHNFGIAGSDGNAIVYPMTGGVGTAYAGIINEFVSKRTPASGWQTTSTTPKPATINISPVTTPTEMVPSTDFKRFLFTSVSAFVQAEPHHEASGFSTSSVNIFLSENPAGEPEWLGAPQLANPVPAPGEVRVYDYWVAGASADLGTVYFTYAGTLVPEDAPRASRVESAFQTREFAQVSSFGFYEWTKGHLVSAGVLPDGTVSAFGAVPAGLADGRWARGTSLVHTARDAQGYEAQAEELRNEVSQDGSRAFFVSPDPQGGSVEPSQLYVRERTPTGGHVAVLVSASQVGGHENEAAPHGATYSFATPDGSHVFFSNRDRLTEAAPENTEVKEYVYDLDNGSLTYMPDVGGYFTAVSNDGSELLFETEGQAKLWHAGANGGTVTIVTALPGGEPGGEMTDVHVSDDGQTIVFRHATAPFHFGEGAAQIYRYDVPTKELDCISCLPSGATPTGTARMSYNNSKVGAGESYSNQFGTTIETRGMSLDGNRIFFDTPEALVPQDTNGNRDVYEWESGIVHLISSGTSADRSLYLDSSETGGDVFFATSQGLVPGDNDGSYDVYDARIPHPGDNPPPGRVPCQGSVCQGPPSVPDLLGLPASATFSGAGNVTPTPEVTSKAAKPKQKKKAHRKRRRRKGNKTGVRARHNRGGK